MDEKDDGKEKLMTLKNLSEAAGYVKGLTTALAFADKYEDVKKALALEMKDVLDRMTVAVAELKEQLNKEQEQLLKEKEKK